MAYFRYTIDQKLNQDREDIDTNRDNISATSLALSALQGVVAGVSATASENRVLINNMQSSISAHTQSLNNLFARVGALESAVSSINSAISSLDARVTALENQ